MESKTYNGYGFLRGKLFERDENRMMMNSVYSEFLPLECFWYFWQQKYNNETWNYSNKIEKEKYLPKREV